MDGKWIDYNIDTLKNHTEVIKSLFRGKGVLLLVTFWIKHEFIVIMSF